MFALIADVKGLNGINDNRTISTGLFLKTGMAVIPVGAALIDIKFVTKSFSWFNAAEMVAYAWHAIHCARQDHSMPVNRTIHGHVVGDI